MLESKAISPEVKGLFDTIRDQAQEYARAFEFLQIEKNLFDRKKEELEALSNKVINDVQSALNELARNYQDSLSLIESKSDKIIRIYNDLDNIRELRDSLSTIHESINKQQFEIDSVLKTLKMKTDIEIDSTLTSIKNKIDKELEQEMQRVELKLTMKLKQIDGKMAVYDQRLFNLSDAHIREFKDLSDDIEKIKRSIITVRQNADEEHRTIESRIIEAREDLTRKIEIIDSMINSFEMNTEIKSYEKNSSFRNEELENEILSLKKGNNKLQTQVLGLEQKFSTTIKVLGAAAFVIIVLIVLVLV